jgi:chromosome segregation ATPase
MKSLIVFLSLAIGCGPHSQAVTPESTTSVVTPTYASELDAALATAKRAEQVIKAIEANRVTAALDPSALQSLEGSNREIEEQLEQLDRSIQDSAHKLRGLRSSAPDSRNQAAVELARWRQLSELAKAEVVELEAAMKVAAEAQASFDRQYAAATQSERARVDETRRASKAAIRNGLVKIGETRAAAEYADRVVKIYAD